MITIQATQLLCIIIWKIKEELGGLICYHARNTLKINLIFSKLFDHLYH